MTTKEQLDERYGRTARPGRRRAFWITVGTLGAASVIALAWVTISNSTGTVGFDETGHQIVDEHAVKVSFQVTPPRGAAFACAFEALDEQFGVVGFTVVDFPASESTTTPFTQTIPTVALATTGLVQACWVT